MKNPIEKRLRAEALKKLAGTFVVKKNFTWWAILYSALLFIVAGWLPDGITEVIRGEWIEGACKAGLSVLILLVIGKKVKKALEHESKIEVVTEETTTVAALAVFLSVLSMDKKKQDEYIKVIEGELGTHSFKVDNLNGKTWEMPILAIKHHLPKLKRLYVITSSGENGSSKLMPVFQGVVNCLFAGVEVIEMKKGGIDFEDVKNIFEALEGFYKDIEKKGISGIVDITGGQKTNSIAAAITTLAIGRKFQYVSTKDKKVLSYDVVCFPEE